jgi:uncharacterized protein YjbI with pentapeptide repeats
MSPKFKRVREIRSFNKKLDFFKKYWLRAKGHLHIYQIDGFKWRKVFKYIYRFFVWLIWEFSGAKSIVMKIVPNRFQGQEAPTFFLWLIGIYIAGFGIASQRYENTTYKIDNLVSSMISVLPTEMRDYALQRIPKIQWEPCPFKPEILDPRSVWLSLFGDSCQYESQVEHLKNILEENGKKLNSLNLGYCDLRGTIFINSNFEKTNLGYSKMEQAIFGGVNFKSAFFFNGKFNKSWFSRCDFKGADLNSVCFEGTFFNECNLAEAKGIEIEQLLECRSIYKCQLKPEWENIIKEKYPNRLEWPKDGIPQNELLILMKRNFPDTMMKIFEEHTSDN